MKKNLLLLSILLLCILNIYALGLEELLLGHTFMDEEIHPVDGLSLKYAFNEFFYTSQNNGTKSYGNDRLEEISFFSSNSIFCSIGRTKNEFYDNNFSEIDDLIKLNSNYKNFTLGEYTMYSENIFSFSQKKYNLFYALNNLIGEIPLTLYDLDFAFRYKNSKLNIGLRTSKQNEENYNNSFNRISLGVSQTFNSKLFLQVRFSNYTIDLKKGIDQFLLINNLQYISYSGAYRHLNHQLGFSGAHLRISERGVVNVEPFAGYYSLFFGSKSFIKSIDPNLWTLFYQFNKDFYFYKLNSVMQLEYHHLLSSGAIEYTERKWLIEGILPNDETVHSWETDTNFDAFIKLMANINCPVWLFETNLKISQLIPIKYSLPKSGQPSGGIKKKTHGGTFMELSLGYRF